jgi:hypothetical protein
MAQVPRAHLLTNSIVGLDKFYPKNSNVCTTCIKGKQHCEKFPKEGGLKAINVLGLIHYDICGQIQTSTYYGCTYFITFIDDYKRYTIMYLLHHKSKAFAKFKQFKQLVENQTNYQIKVLRVDNGGEYKLKEFTQFC